MSRDYEVSAESKYRSYRRFRFYAESEEDAIEQFLDYKNKRREFFSSIKAKPVQGGQDEK